MGYYLITQETTNNESSKQSKTPPQNSSANTQENKNSPRKSKSKKSKHVTANSGTIETLQNNEKNESNYSICDYMKQTQIEIKKRKSLRWCFVLLFGVVFHAIFSLCFDIEIIFKQIPCVIGVPLVMCMVACVKLLLFRI